MEVATVNGNGAHSALEVKFSDEQIGLLKRTICKGATDDEFQLFLGQCRRTKLDPFARQIHAVKRWDRKENRWVMSIQTGIDGYRLIADRTGRYEGQTSPLWCGEDGVWKDVWLSKEPPVAAKVGVHKTGFREPIYTVALWSEYVQTFTTKDGKTMLSPMWAKMGALMLSKCAEALALRKAFPQELSGIYTQEEMAQADTAPAITEAQEVSPEEKVQQEETEKGWRSFRAKVNKSLTEAKTSADIEKKKKGVEDLSKNPNIWNERTWHYTTRGNSEREYRKDAEGNWETFGTLLALHTERVKQDEHLASPEGIKEWIRDMSRSKLADFPMYVQMFREQARLATQEVEDALTVHARNLGLNSFAEAEPDNEIHENAGTPE